MSHEHPEWKRDNSLTAPTDLNPDKKMEVKVSAPSLNDDQLKEAMTTLNIPTFVEKFPTIERRFADPPLEMQKIGLISFVPAKGAVPNEKGIYGFAKLRGNFATENEANEQAERIIRNVDSYHRIYHCYVGRPFPITISPEFSKETTVVDLQKDVATSVAEDVKKKREQEQKEIEEIKERERQLLEDVKKEKEETDDHYTTLRVKKAQLVWTYIETTKKLKQVLGHIAKARKEIEDLDTTHPELKEAYFKKYMEARKQLV